MISAQVQATVRANCYGYYLTGEIMLPCNVCAHCGECDDPESARRWPEDEDGDRICPACARTA